MNTKDANDLAAFRRAFPLGVTAVLSATPAGMVNGIHAVSIQIPPFRSHDPDSWFRRIEAQFHTRSIVDDKIKVNFVVGSLDSAIHWEIGPTIDSLPATNAYAELRKVTIASHGLTQAQMDAELFAVSRLNDHD